jgi:general secretion pathway protein C
MKKRLPLLISLILFVLLSGSATYWGMHLFKPKARPIAAPPPPPQPEIPLEAAAGLFGGKLVAQTVANFQLKGVIASLSGRSGTVMVAVDGKPLRAYGVGNEIMPGVKIEAIFPKYVQISDNGASKRINLPENKGGGISSDAAPPQPDPNASRMTGPALPLPQPNVPGVPQEPQQQQPGQPPQPPQQGIVPPQPLQQPGVGPNGEPLNNEQFNKHNK